MAFYLILGCTASGKGAAAFELSRRIGGEIVSIDSMKVYRRMDIGTAKPSAAKRAAVRHHLIDVVEPWEAFSLGRYVELADEAIREIRAAEGPIIAAGGTAMYIRGLLEGIFEGPAADAEMRERLRQEAAAVGLAELHGRLAAVDPEAAARIHPNDEKRIVRALEVWELTGQPISAYQQQFRSGNYRYPWRIFGLRREKEDNNRRINSRVKKMIEAGLVAEVRGLLAEPRGLSEQAAQAVGYAEIITYLENECSLEEAIEQIKINTRRFAKSQRTWFRSFRDVSWIDVEAESPVEEIVEKIISYV